MNLFLNIFNFPDDDTTLRDKQKRLIMFLDNNEKMNAFTSEMRILGFSPESSFLKTTIVVQYDFYSSRFI